jgi:RNA-directed DNA polymerase
LGLLDAIRGLFSNGAKPAAPPAGHLSVTELARRLGATEAELRSVPIAYRSFHIPKRSGGYRTIYEPGEDLKRAQRLLLRRLLKRLAAHPRAHGFERGKSTVTGALPHERKSVVVRMDLRDFFGSIKAARVRDYFARAGWDADASRLLTRLCTREGSLPQGAPTSPRLSNLVNFKLDARLDALARKCGADYTRYADDMTFSFAEGGHAQLAPLIRAAKKILREEGYELNTRKKLQIRRRHHRQTVTGLVVNDRVALPRATRRWLRAVEHRASQGRETTLTPAQLEGWRALGRMVSSQSKGVPADSTREGDRTGGHRPPPGVGQ